MHLASFGRKQHATVTIIIAMWHVSRGERSEEEDCSIGAHLMRVRDGSGQPLPFVRLWSELSIFFMAGMETTAHAITWALCAAPPPHLETDQSQE